MEQVDEWIAAAEAQAGLARGSVALVCNIETARGLANAEAIARARPRVLGRGCWRSAAPIWRAT